MQGMFDVFDIVLGHLSTGTRIEVRQRETAFGLSDEQIVYVDGMMIACVDPTSGLGRTVLLASTAANQASADDADWKRLLRGLVVLLDAHPGWRVTCESDCDQHPIRQSVLSPKTLRACSIRIGLLVSVQSLWM